MYTKKKSCFSLNILECYLAKNTALTWFILTSVLTFFYMLHAWSGLLKHPIPYSDSEPLFWLLLPKELASAMSLSLVLSVLYTLGDINNRSEYIGFNGCGIHAVNASKGIVWLALFVSSIILLLNLTIIPSAEGRIEELLAPGVMLLQLN